ncbi:serine/threonine-protein phosphatase 2b catalytic subunit 1-related [Anaeramoeba flamelloides]|uniref:Serine/threonine-protein phosphatase 2b catalytic subunit 1-related n=1 Tax=Anaeramoeba flamelloides TaxID=1746091 RepID=A0ABQ8YJJ8_9EUKA|nr:serine/threonine-protein phosphatase 2b catalytic subunit 1-related [Anaeramoeba flamelloides]
MNKKKIKKLQRSSLSKKQNKNNLQQKKRQKPNCGDDRIMSDVPEPTRKILDHGLLFEGSSNTPNYKLLKKHFYNEGKISNDDAVLILTLARKILRKEPNLLYIKSPVNIFGDLHGQYYDLVQFIEKVGYCSSKKKYLFVGDYVDRGNFGIEIILFFNHECKRTTSFFNFRKDTTEKYNERVYKYCLKAFDALPLCAIVDDQFFCVHAGLSPKIKKVDTINKINRFKEIDTSKAIGDLLWSDPQKDYNNPKKNTKKFIKNVSRSCSYRYSFRAVERFLKANKLTCVIRGHESCQNGYRMYKKSKLTGFPTLITLFSCPNYLGVYTNKGAVIEYTPNSLIFKEFKGATKPYYLSKNIDVFKWSIPFFVERMHGFLECVVTIKGDKEKDKQLLLLKPNLNNKREDGNVFLTHKQGRIIKYKVKFLAGLVSDFTRIRNISNKDTMLRRARTLTPISIVKLRPQNSFNEMYQKIKKTRLLRSMSVKEIKVENQIMSKKLYLSLQELNQDIIKRKKELAKSNIGKMVDNKENIIDSLSGSSEENEEKSDLDSDSNSGSDNGGQKKKHSKWKLKRSSTIISIQKINLQGVEKEKKSIERGIELSEFLEHNIINTNNEKNEDLDIIKKDEKNDNNSWLFSKK